MNAKIRKDINIYSIQLDNKQKDDHISEWQIDRILKITRDKLPVENRSIDRVNRILKKSRNHICFGRRKNKMKKKRRLKDEVDEEEEEEEEEER